MTCNDYHFILLTFIFELLDLLLLLINWCITDHSKYIQRIDYII